jgi:hypothetical protein
VSKIFIIGSKPQANWPRTDPDIIYTANGALARAQRWSEQAQVNALFLNRFFRKNQRSAESSTAAAVHGCVADKVIVSGGANAKEGFVSPSERGLRYRDIERLTRARSFKIKLAFSGVHLVIKEFMAFMASPRDYAKLLRKTRQLQSFSCSTGVLALLIAAKRSQDTDVIYLIGIGGSPGDGHFYDNEKKFERHIEQDEFFIRRVKKKLKRRLVVTDEKLSAKIS